MRGATCSRTFAHRIGIFQSTRPMRGATKDKNGDTISNSISIHAPHAGRDRVGGPAAKE